MDDRAAERVKAAAAGKDLRYFSKNGLGGLLEEVGVGRDPAAVADALRLLAGDDVCMFVGAVAAGLREAASDDDEFARLVSGIAGEVRYDLAQGPVIRSLIEIGKSDPGTGAALAARLVGLGDADYAAFLAGGARAGAPSECDRLADSLLSSGDPGHVAAGLRLLRVAHGEHGAPDAAAAADAADAAIRSGDERVACESVELLLDIYGEVAARAGPAIEGLARAQPACRPVIASRIANRSPFDSRSALRCLDICISGVDGRGDDACVHDICRALEGLAGEQPDGVTQSILGLVRRGAYADKHGGRVLEELGKRRALAASSAILGMLRGADGPILRRHLPSMMRRLALHAALLDAAGPFMDALEAGPAAAGHCLAALYPLAVVNHLGRRNQEPAAALLRRLQEHSALGSAAHDGYAPAPDPSAALCNLIDGIRRPGAAAGRRPDAGTGAAPVPPHTNLAVYAAAQGPQTYARAIVLLVDGRLPDRTAPLQQERTAS